MWDAETITNDEQVVADQLPCPLRVEIAMNIQPRFLPPPLRSKGGFKALPPKANS